jgi:hypothetical protein
MAQRMAANLAFGLRGRDALADALRKLPNRVVT